jgi:hypothetical protein
MLNCMEKIVGEHSCGEWHEGDWDVEHKLALR